MIVHYKTHQVSEYINWIYFFHAWGFQPKYAAIADIHGCDSCRAMWLAGFPEKERPKAAEAMQLLKEAHRMLNELDADFETHGVFRLMDANADGDNLYLDGSTRFPLLRQQAVKCKADEPFLCLSDFVRPLSSGIKDKVGAFATTVDADMEHLYDKDDYKRMLVQTLADRLAEATAEKVEKKAEPAPEKPVKKAVKAVKEETPAPAEVEKKAEKTEKAVKAEKVEKTETAVKAESKTVKAEKPAEKKTTAKK